jgi:hypothetical protein
MHSPKRVSLSTAKSHHDTSQDDRKIAMVVLPFLVFTSRVLAFGRLLEHRQTLQKPQTSCRSNNVFEPAALTTLDR